MNEEVQTIYFADGDNDGFGDIASTIDAVSYQKAM